MAEFCKISCNTSVTNINQNLFQISTVANRLPSCTYWSSPVSTVKYSYSAVRYGVFFCVLNCAIYIGTKCNAENRCYAPVGARCGEGSTSTSFSANTGRTQLGVTVSQEWAGSGAVQLKVQENILCLYHQVVAELLMFKNNLSSDTQGWSTYNLLRVPLPLQNIPITRPDK